MDTQTVTKSGIINFKEEVAKLAEQFYNSIENFLTDHENKFKGKMQILIKRPMEGKKIVPVDIVWATMYYWPINKGPNDTIYTLVEIKFKPDKKIRYEIHLGKDVFVDTEREGDADEMLAQLEKDLEVAINYFENPNEITPEFEK